MSVAPILGLARSRYAFFEAAVTDLSSTAYLPRRRIDARSRERSAALAPWLLLGIGLGGLVDGIVFHEILQWHNMLSNAVPPTDLDRIRFNVLADGLFHAAAWVVTLLGLILLWRSVRSGQSNRSSAGAFGTLLGGVGLFNLVEGIVNHHLLELHNVREVADPTQWNLGFLLLGGVLPLALGALLRQRALHAPQPVSVAQFDEQSTHRTAAEVDGRDVRLVQILLPLARHDGQPVDARTFETVKDELTANFGGLTAYTRSPAEGRWLGKRQETDDVVVFEVMCPDVDRRWWQEYRQRLERLFEQERIVIRVEQAELL